jgi:NAD(P)-dependent dehydrogenase (short-subunit alcohol dehydrogenase family)
MMMENKTSSWDATHIPSQAGRAALVTGANTGLGFETARILAGCGADVILACRDRIKGAKAVERILALHPNAAVSLLPVDLSDLDSVKTAAKSVLDKHTRLDLLINNAGVMAPPYSKSRQGYENQLATNYLGHFALTGRLLPLILATPSSRVVSVSSAAANFGRLDLSDLNFERRKYSRWGAYNQSKLATLMFSQELAKKFATSGSNSRASAAHPGGAATDLQRNTWYFRWLVNPFLAASASDGALPTLRAATDLEAANGSYWGPSKFFQMRGAPTKINPTSRALDDDLAKRLWKVSEDMTDVVFEFADVMGKD